MNVFQTEETNGNVLLLLQKISIFSNRGYLGLTPPGKILLEIQVLVHTFSFPLETPFPVKFPKTPLGVGVDSFWKYTNFEWQIEVTKKLALNHLLKIF